MMIARKRTFVISAALLGCLAAAGVVAQTVVSLQRLSLNLQGEGATGISIFNSISPNGRYFVFRSTAPDIVAGDTNGAIDIFVRDLQTGAVTRVQQGTVEPDGASNKPAASSVAPNGFAAITFETDATNLASPLGTPDGNGVTDVYFHIPQSNITERVSMAPLGILSNGSSREPSIAIKAAPNRIYVAYTSDATNLIAGEADVNDSSDIFLATITAPSALQDFVPSRDISTIRVSRTDTADRQPNSDARRPSISGDGRFVVYESDSTNIISGVAPSATQVYIYDSLTGGTALVSRTPAGLPGNAASQAPSISFSGDFVVYTTAATDILSDGLVPAGPQVVRYDIRKGVSERVNVSGNITGSAVTDTQQSDPALQSDQETLVSADGRLIIFADNSSSLVSNDINGTADVFLKDMGLGTVTRLSVGVSGSAANDASGSPTIGRQGYTSLTSLGGFSSAADNLVDGDDEARRDAFLSAVTTQAMPLTATTLLEVPPDVTMSGPSITVKMESFAGIKLRARKRGAARSSARRRRKPARIRYLVTATNEVTGQIRRRASKRNTLTLANLSPGTYSVRYQAQIRRGARVVRSTAPSAEERLSL